MRGELDANTPDGPSTSKGLTTDPSLTVQDHEIDAMYVPVCSVCDSNISYNDETQGWEHH